LKSVEGPTVLASTHKNIHVAVSVDYSATLVSRVSISKLPGHRVVRATEVTVDMLRDAPHVMMNLNRDRTATTAFTKVLPLVLSHPFSGNVFLESNVVPTDKTRKSSVVVVRCDHKHLSASAGAVVPSLLLSNPFKDFRAVRISLPIGHGPP